MNSKQPVREAIPSSQGASLPFSAAITYDNLVFVSGAIGRDPETGTMALGDVQAQTAQTMKNIGRTLAAAGTSLDNVLKMTVFLVDMSLFKDMNDTYRTFFPSNPPARSCVAVSALPDPEALVEIEAIAAK